MSGILGFAMKAAAADGSETLMETLYNQKQIESKVFSVSIKGIGNQSEWIIGDPDPAKYREKIVWGEILKPDQMGMWFTQLTGVLVSNHSTLSNPHSDDYDVNSSSQTGTMWLDECHDRIPCLALVDTGTSLLMVPSRTYDKLLQYLEHHVMENGADSACFLNSSDDPSLFMCET